MARNLLKKFSKEVDMNFAIFLSGLACGMSLVNLIYVLFPNG